MEFFDIFIDDFWPRFRAARQLSIDIGFLGSGSFILALYWPVTEQVSWSYDVVESEL